MTENIRHICTSFSVIYDASILALSLNLQYMLSIITANTHTVHMYFRFFMTNDEEDSVIFVRVLYTSPNYYNRICYALK